MADRRPRRLRRPGALTFPVQVGGAAGPGPPSSCGATWPVTRRRALGRTPPPWHTTRTPGHPAGDALVALHRRLGPDRRRRAGAVAARDRRAQRGRRRRLVDDAAQGQPGALGAGPARRADHAAARRHPAPRRRRRRSTSAPTAPGTPSGRRCATWSRTLVAAPTPSTWSPSSGARRPDGCDLEAAAHGARRAARWPSCRAHRARRTSARRALVDAVIDRTRRPAVA